jgi:hypothetical protein
MGWLPKASLTPTASLLAMTSSYPGACVIA